MLRAWTSERLTFAGEFHRFDDVEVLPKPLQKPLPPTWVAASSEPAIDWAAERGFSILMDPHSSHREIARKQRLYLERLAEHGHVAEGRDLPVARLLAVAPTLAEAEGVARRGASWIVGSYADEKHRPVLPFGGLERREPAKDPVDRYMNGVILYATPESLVDQITKLRAEMNLEYLMCAPLSH